MVFQVRPNPPSLSPWPMSRLPGWVDRVNKPVSEAELAAVRLSAQRGKRLGDDGRVESIARRHIAAGSRWNQPCVRASANAFDSPKRRSG